MFKRTLEEYKKEINSQYDHAIKVDEAFHDKAFISDSYKLAIIGMCIKYEALTSDLEEIVFKKQPRYNHPWSNTRVIAKELGIDITEEYKLAHDSWDLYNSLKHINDQTEEEKEKFFNKYNIKDIKQAAEFVRRTLINLIEVFEKS